MRTQVTGQDGLTAKFRAELKKHGISWSMPGGSSGVAHCNKCGYGWSPMLRTGGCMPRGWWKCPKGCNC